MEGGPKRAYFEGQSTLKEHLNRVKYKLDCSQIHVDIVHWVWMNFYSKQVESNLSLQRRSNLKYGHIVWEIQTWLLTNPYKSWILNAEKFPF